MEVFIVVFFFLANHWDLWLKNRFLFSADETRWSCNKLFMEKRESKYLPLCHFSHELLSTRPADGSMVNYFARHLNGFFSPRKLRRRSGRRCNVMGFNLLPLSPLAVCVCAFLSFFLCFVSCFTSVSSHGRNFFNYLNFNRRSTFHSFLLHNFHVRKSLANLFLFAQQAN